MIEDASSLNTVNKIPAILTMDIEYNCIVEGQKLIPANTLIHVDVDNDIALIGNTHIHIDSHEYRALYS